jgi:hypothetical protein
MLVQRWPRKPNDALGGKFRVLPVSAVCGADLGPLMQHLAAIRSDPETNVAEVGRLRRDITKRFKVSVVAKLGFATNDQNAAGAT